MSTLLIHGFQVRNKHFIPVPLFPLRESRVLVCPGNHGHNLNTTSTVSLVMKMLTREPIPFPHTGLRVQSKSILRDPICEALRAQIKTGILETNSPLEAEIDDLLHGRGSGAKTSPVLVDNVIILREVPYVSMIEVKYRSRSHLPTHSAASVATPSPSSTTYTTSSNYSRSIDSS